jgi:hypothetical protein
VSYLEFEGELPLPAWYHGGYDCRICMAMGGDETVTYQARTNRSDKWVDGRLDHHVMRVQVGEKVICLPDHNYAHSDHNNAERLTYGEMLEARFPRNECERMGVYDWLAQYSG